MPDQNLDKTEKIIRVPCKNCGNELTYDAGSAQLTCSRCGSSQEPPKATDMIVERSFTEALAIDSSPKGLGLETKNIDCKNCGAVTTVEPDVPTISCSFCGSESVNESSFDKNTIQPAGVLPFTIEKQKAFEEFKEWIGKGWFHPSRLKSVTRLDKINGVYVPFWTYDAHTDSSWTADAGYHYYETEYYTDSDGNQQSRQVQHTRWEPASGYYSHWFDDVLVIASGGVTQAAIQKVYPYELNKVINYDSQYLIGWKSEVYKTDVKEGFTVADGIMDTHIQSACASMVPGDTHRNLNVNTRKSNITFKHLLLPVWIAAYGFSGKTYQVLINGQTGKIAGEKPLSTMKIVLTVLLVIIIGLLIWYFTKQ